MHDRGHRARKPSYWQYLILSLVIVAIYCPTFTGGFISDDNAIVKNNPYVKELHSIYSYLSQEDGISEGEPAGEFHTGYYRPLMNLTYWIDYKVWGMNAGGFRTTNVLLHILATFLLLKLMARFIEDRWAAFIAVLLFAVHPVNTEAVSWFSSRDNIIVTIFSLTSLHLYMIGCESGNRRAFILSVLSFFGALLSKELGLMILPIMFLYNRLLTENKRSVRTEVLSYIPFLVVTLIYFLLRYNATEAVLSPSGMGDMARRIYFAPFILAFNLKLIFLPGGLHSFLVAYPDSFLDWRAIFSIALIPAGGVLLWVTRYHRMVHFALLSFVVALFPVLNIVQTSASSLVSMRWIYFPMTFIAMGIAWCLQRVMVSRRRQAVLYATVVAVYLGSYSYILNAHLWHNEEVFFTQEIMQFDNHLYAGSMGEQLFKQGKYLQAEEYFRIAMEKYPRTARHYINYSAMLIELGRMEKAHDLLERSEHLHMVAVERSEWLNNMAIIKTSQGRFTEAREYLSEALRIMPDFPGALNNMGVVLMGMGKREEAIQHFQKALYLRPDYGEAKNNLKKVIEHTD